MGLLWDFLHLGWDPTRGDDPASNFFLLHVCLFGVVSRAYSQTATLLPGRSRGFLAYSSSELDGQE